MSETHCGSCLCGQVRFEVQGAFERFFLCHCSHCRKDSGSAHAANLFSSTASLQWLTGQESVRSFNLPATRHTRSFCTACGSALPYADAAGGFLVVPAGSLDSELRRRPDAHLFTASRAAWDQGLESIPSFPGFPS
ncbi:GFA family protein [Stagnimonas aquatica]|uniref:GFA family protein n=1 Tax=Stagnimonas aquatica TaxID=2689987 RepID=A0A3N0VE38_9GAMM|nr:GFA family protein [Stagnimonas aquatica]ROH90942.1 GFA family protein [Stagnimonas aquatica]